MSRTALDVIDGKLFEGLRSCTDFLFDNHRNVRGSIHYLPEDSEYLEALEYYETEPTFVEIAKKFKKLKILLLNRVFLKQIHPSIVLFAGSTLIKLSFAGNVIKDLRPLCKLTQLKILNVEKNMIKSLEPLKSLKKLESLHCSENEIETMKGLELLSELRFLHIKSNPIRSRKPFIHLFAVNKLRKISINHPKYIDSYKGLPSGVSLSFARCQMCVYVDIIDYMCIFCRTDHFKIWEISGTKKFKTLTENPKNSYISWIDKINIFTLYKFF